MSNIDVREYLTQGAVLAGQERYEEALSYYEKAAQADPSNVDVYLAKGIAYASLDRLDMAKMEFENALQVDRSSGLAYFHLGSVALLEGDIAGGFELYNKAVASGYDDAQLYFSIGLLHEEIGEPELAIRNYSKAIGRDPLRPDIRIRKAELLIDGNQIPEALETLDETILSSPDVFEGYHMKFLLLLQLKQFDDAESLLEKALVIFPKDPGFALDKVSLRVEQGKNDEALELLAELETKEETDYAVHRKIYMERAQIYAVKEDMVKAISALEQAKALSETNDEFDAKVIFLLINCHLATEEYEKVQGYSLELLENVEDGYEKETARYYLPLALKMLDRLDEALPLYEEAIRHFRDVALESPGNLDAYLLRTMCLLDTEQYDKGLELINYVIALQPERAEPRLLRVRLLEAAGRLDEAKAESEILKQHLPN